MANDDVSLEVQIGREAIALVQPLLDHVRKITGGRPEVAMVVLAKAAIAICRSEQPGASDQDVRKWLDEANAMLLGIESN